jgi:hypothetical protein
VVVVPLAVLFKILLTNRRAATPPGGKPEAVGGVQGVFITANWKTAQGGGEDRPPSLLYPRAKRLSVPFDSIVRSKLLLEVGRGIHGGPAVVQRGLEFGNDLSRIRRSL